MKIRLIFLFLIFSTFLVLHSVLALSDDRYIIEIDEKFNISDSLKLNVIEEIKSVKHLRQVAGVGIGLGKKIIVVSNTTIEDLEKEKNITYIEPDYKVYSLGKTTPWNFELVGFNFSKIDEKFGKNVRIAVLDTGADYNLLSVKSGYDFVNEDSDAFDDNGHGTFVSQILKLPNSDLPLPSSEIYAVKVLDENGQGFVSDVIEGINWAMNNDIDIISMSFGGDGDSSFLKEIINEAYNQGLLLVGAAGNDNRPIILFPAAYDNVVSVGSINKNLERSSFSNYGDKLDFVAPGENFVVTDGISLSVVRGTSFTVPHVGAVAAAYLSDNISLSNDALLEKLRENALDLGQEGKDREFGYGLVRYDNDSDIHSDATEICNNIDDDFDEQIDEDLTRPTTCGVGACAGNTGEETCIAGVWGDDTCDPYEGAVTDDATCNDIDDDCDTLIDEDYITTPTTCGISVCLSTGQLECQSGTEIDTCVPGSSSPELCDDDIDNDCDGEVDEGACLSIGVYSPTEGITNERRMLFNLTTDIEVDEITYIDYADRSPRWRILCRNCDEYGNIRERTKSFRDGEHNLSFRAVKDGNYVEKNVSFFIDSRDPRISKTEPRSGFASGNFYVEFTELNPESLVLTYGNSLRNKSVDLSRCYESGRIKACDVYVNLSDFDGEEIGYWFTLNDTAGNSDESTHRTVSVDQTDPVIDNFDLTVDGRRVTFNISVTEQNFDEIEYMDNEDRRPRWRTLCSRLRDDICLARKSFTSGFHNLSINVTDEAGNYASREDILFTI